MESREKNTIKVFKYHEHKFCLIVQLMTAEMLLIDNVASDRSQV